MATQIQKVGEKARTGPRWWAILLAAWIPLILVTRTESTVDHEFSRLGTIENVVERGHFWLDDSQFSTTIDKIFYSGHFYSHQPPLLSALESPVYWLISLGGIRFSPRVPFDLAYFLFAACTLRL